MDSMPIDGSGVTGSGLEGGILPESGEIDVAGLLRQYNLSLERPNSQSSKGPDQSSGPGTQGESL